MNKRRTYGTNKMTNHVLFSLLLPPPNLYCFRQWLQLTLKNENSAHEVYEAKRTGYSHFFPTIVLHYIITLCRILISYYASTLNLSDSPDELLQMHLNCKWGQNRYTSLNPARQSSLFLFPPSLTHFRTLSFSVGTVYHVKGVESGLAPDSTNTSRRDFFTVRHKKWIPKLLPHALR